MLTISEVSLVALRLREMGYTKKEYARSKLYRIVKEKVLERDGGLCRRLGKCLRPATRLGYVEANHKTLAGQCNLIFSLCDGCYAEAVVVSPPDSERLTLNKTFYLVSGVRKLLEQSNQNIGVWYRSQLTNDLNAAYNDLIMDEIQSSSPEDWERVKEYWS